MKKDSRIYVAGHTGLVGSEILKELKKRGYNNIITATHKKLDLTDQLSTNYFFKKNKPDYVFLAAAKVGGIKDNFEKPADYIYQNLQIELNVINSSYVHKVKKLVFLGSSCIYPKFAEQPIKEEYLLTGPLETTNEGYAIAKIAGIKMCNKYNEQYGTNFISLMPTNLYGNINDNYDLESSHVLPAMIRKFHDAKIKNDDSVRLWGTGKPKREFLHISDMADAAIFCMNKYEDYSEHVNIGTGEDISIKELAEIIKNVVGFKGDIIWDTSMPDGTPRKLLDVSKIHSIGWKYRIGLEEGIKKTYKMLLHHHPYFEDKKMYMKMRLKDLFSRK
jgi:GDP-L-fucose synthase